MINVYDFDKTIYNGDSSIDFYLYCLKRKKSIIFLLPIQIYAAILYILGLKEKEYFKEKFFSFLKKINNIDEYVEDFWNKKINKIKSWYLEQKDKSDVIISASPEFLLKPLEKKLNVEIIATKVNKRTGKFESKNCHGKEKVVRFTEKVKNKEINKFYSDPLSDKPMMELAKNSYLVNKNTIYDLSK
jgi:phosphoserine phosphatase